MSAFTLRWCKEHGYWEDDVDSPTEACPTCIESGAFKTRAQLERELANCKRDLAAAEAKLAAVKPDVAGLVRLLEEKRETNAALNGAPAGILADALLSLSAQLAEKEAECTKWKDEHHFQACLTKELLPYQERAVKAEAECEGLRERLQDFIAEHDNACIEQKGNTLTLLWSRNNDMVARAKAAIAARDCAVYKPLPKEVRDGILTLLTK